MDPDSANKLHDFVRERLVAPVRALQPTRTDRHNCPFQAEQHLPTHEGPAARKEKIQFSILHAASAVNSRSEGVHQPDDPADNLSRWHNKPDEEPEQAQGHHHVNSHGRRVGDRHERTPDVLLYI